MERLTQRGPDDEVNFGVEQDPDGAYNVCDLANCGYEEIAHKVAERLAEYEDEHEKWVETYEFCRQAIQRYGCEKQKLMVIEECSELIKAICKNSRSYGNIENITEEIADVEITLQQLKIIFSVMPTRLDEIKRHKIQRMRDRWEVEACSTSE